MIHTANGIYVGDFKEPINYDNFDFKNGDDVFTIAHKSYQSLVSKDDMPNQMEVYTENPLTIQLTNVKLITSNIPISIPSVEIFVDQIIGFSAGSL